MLASDMNNPEFVGATDPDARLHVTFFTKPQPNAFRSEMEGRPIFEDVVFVKLQIPGDQLSIIETPIREEHKRRFPRHWAYWESTQGKDNLQAGTPLSQWPILTPAAVEELKALKFFTVENIANAGDEHLNRMGMKGTMSPFALREKAIRYLTVAKDVSTVDGAKKELDEFKAAAAEKERQAAQREAELKAAMNELRGQVAALVAAAAPKRSPGRPRKVKPEQPEAEAAEA